MAAHVDGVPCFVEAVAGERIHGSWWGHPKGKLIFGLSESLVESSELVSLKLLGGRATLVHSALWPALLAVVLDESWRQARSKTLDRAARALWKKVELASRRGDAPAAVDALEESLLVHCAPEHTEKGRHEKRLTSWSEWARSRGVKPARGGVEAALEQLERSANGHATRLSRSRVG